MIVLVHKRICNLIFYIFGMMLFLDCVLSSNPNILMMQPKALQREVGCYPSLNIEFYK